MVELAQDERDELEAVLKSSTRRAVSTTKLQRARILLAPWINNGIRISGKGSWSLRMSCNRLIYGKIFGSVGILQKNTYVSAWVMAIYA